jgi:hypothetical protein
LLELVFAVLLFQKFDEGLEGYMPTTEQTIANLRTLLASDVLNLRNQDIGSVRIIW